MSATTVRVPEGLRRHARGMAVGPALGLIALDLDCSPRGRSAPPYGAKCWQ
jgi:hypothetical protein